VYINLMVYAIVYVSLTPSTHALERSEGREVSTSGTDLKVPVSWPLPLRVR